MAIIHKIGAGIHASDGWPTAPSARPGQILTSDNFTGAGDLVGNMTDGGGGGSQLRWEGTPGVMQRLGSRARSYLGLPNPVLLPMSVSDYVIEVAVTALPTTATSLVARRETINILGGAATYQATIHPGGLINLAHRKNTNTTLGSWSGVSAGDRIGLAVKGDRISVSVNGVERIVATDSQISSPGYAGIAPTADMGPIALSALTITAL